MFRPAKPETFARYAAKRQQDNAVKRNQFEKAYIAAQHEFPLLPSLSTLELDRTTYWTDFPDGRAVAISWHGFREE